MMRSTVLGEAMGKSDAHLTVAQLGSERILEVHFLEVLPDKASTFDVKHTSRELLRS